MKPLLLLLLAAVLFPARAWSKNLHVIDKDDRGFVMVRTGRPSLEDFREMCRLGVRKMIVMSGNGAIERGWADKECPGFEVVYDSVQSTKVPLAEDFLADFDGWVKYAREHQEGLAFRCNCGCHRTGRLAAYYKMKYMKKDGEPIGSRDAVKDQRDMAPFPATLLFRRVIKLQVRALKDHIDGKECSQKPRYCVTKFDRSPKAGMTATPDAKVDADEEGEEAYAADVSPTEK